MTGTSRASRHVIYRFSDFSFDASTLNLSRGEQEIPLDSTLRGVLLLLLSMGGQVVTKEEFLDHVWRGKIVEEGNLTVAISRLRKALGELGPAVIKTVPKVGYKCIADIHRDIIEGPFTGLDLVAGQFVPGSDGGVLEARVGSGGYGEAWRVRSPADGTISIFKFAADSQGLAALRRENAVHALIQAGAESTVGFVPILTSNFSNKPFYVQMPDKGLDLVRWVDSKGGCERVALSTRLWIAAEVCRVVDQAHRMGIFHQDIKPSNILIDEENDRLSVYVADFGSSAVLNADRIMALSISQHVFERTASDSWSNGATPQYVAPELAKGVAPNTQTDVFSIGVLLYQLACGDLTRPLVSGWEHGIRDELLQSDIYDATHGNPSDRIRTPAALRERLQRLDLRRTKALEDARRAEKTVYLEAQFEKARHRRPWLIGAISILIVGVFVSAGFYFQADRARKETLVSLATVGAMNKFLADDLFRAADPVYGGKKDVTLVDALKKSRSQLSQRFEAGSDLSRGRLLLRMGDIFGRMGLYKDQASTLQEASDALADAGATDEKLIADANRSRSLYRLGQNQQAAKLARDAYSAAVDEFGEHHPAAVVTSIFVARIPYETLVHADSFRAFKDIMPAVEQLPEAYSRYRIDAETTYISILLNLQRMEEAGIKLKPVLARLENEYGRKHPDTMLCRYYLGVQQQYTGRLEMAEKTLRTVLDDMREVQGEEAWNTLNAQGALAQVYLDRGNFLLARDEFSKLYHTRLKLHGETNVSTLAAQRQWGTALRKSSDFKKALEVLRDNASRYTEIHGENHPSSIISAWEVALLLAEMARPSEARQMYESIVEQSKVVLANEPQWLPRKSYLLGRIELAAGHADVALPLLESARDEYVRLFGDRTEFVAEMNAAINAAKLPTI